MVPVPAVDSAARVPRVVHAALVAAADARVVSVAADPVALAAVAVITRVAAVIRAAAVQAAAKQGIAKT